MRRSPNEVYPLHDCAVYALVTIGVTTFSKGFDILIGGKSLQEIVSVVEDRGIDPETIREISSEAAFQHWRADGLSAQSAQAIAFGTVYHRKKWSRPSNQEEPSSQVAPQT